MLSGAGVPTRVSPQGCPLLTRIRFAVGGQPKAQLKAFVESAL